MNAGGVHGLLPVLFELGDSVVVRYIQAGNTRRAETRSLILAIRRTTTQSALRIVTLGLVNLGRKISDLPPDNVSS